MNKLHLFSTVITILLACINPIIISVQAQSIEAGGMNSIVLCENGNIWTFGDNGLGQLGDTLITERNFPAQVQGISNVTDVQLGLVHCLALKSDSTVWSWGSSTSGKLGLGSTPDRYSPVMVSGLTKIVAISAGRSFSKPSQAGSTHNAF